MKILPLLLGKSARHFYPGDERGPNRPARGALLLFSLAALLGFLRLSHQRVFYPYALDLVEEDMLMQAWRFARRLPVFLPPNAQFAPQVYMPLYTWLGGLLLRLAGFQFWPLRLLSLLSTLASAALLSWVVWREAGDRLLALATAALFLTGARLVGGWYDLARVDPLFLFLFLAGMVSAAYGRQTWRGLVMTGLFMGLSLWTKQNGLFLAAVVAVYLLLMARRRAWPYFAAFFLVVAPLLLLERSSDGWLSYYTIEIAYASPLSLARLFHTLTREIAGAMGFLTLMAAAGAGLRLLKAGLRSWFDDPWFLFLAAAVFVSVSGRASVGGNFNNLIPGYSLLCLSPALFLREWKGWTGDPSRPAGLIAIAVVAQMAMSMFVPLSGLPAQLWPDAAMRQAGDSLLMVVQETDGPVMVTMHPSYAIRAGKEEHAHIQSLWHARHRGLDPFPPDFVRLIERQHYALIISDDSQFFERDPALVALLSAYYRPAGLLDLRESPPTLSGPTVRPRILYVPR